MFGRAMLELNTAFEIALAIIGVFSLWAIKTAIYFIEEQKKAKEDLEERVRKVELLVIGEYIKRPEFEAKLDSLTREIFNRFDKLSDKLEENTTIRGKSNLTQD